MAQTYEIRAARAEDVSQLPGIEDSAAILFAADPELVFLIEDGPTSVEEHMNLLAAWRKSTKYDGGTWVAVRSRENNSHENSTPSSNNVVGFAAASLEMAPQGACYIHIHELAVHSQHQRKGLATRLLETIKMHGRILQPTCSHTIVAGLTLTTMRDLSFNKGFYEKLGFRECDPGDLEQHLGSWAAEIWLHDQERFLRIKHRRCFMLCTL